MIEPDKYYLRFAWVPTMLHTHRLIWLKKYYEVRVDIPTTDPVYTIKKISAEEYVFDTLAGKVKSTWPRPI